MSSISLTLSLRGRLLVSSSDIVPKGLFLGNEVGVWYDPSDLTTLFQDSAGTTPVTAAGQPVGRMLDKSGRGNHATQATSAQRPTYGIHPYSGVRNRANGSADVGNNAIWLVSQTQSGVTMTKTASGFDTDGLPYVDVRYVGTSTGTNHDQVLAFGSAVFAGTSGQQATTSVVARVIAGSISNVSGIQARTSEEIAPSTFVGIALGAPVTASVDTTSTATRTLATGNQFRATLSLTFNIASAIDVTYRIKGLQLELGPTRTVYQANYSQYNITEAGVPSVHYIGFDGVDDGMVTSAIDFSTTNKMTVFAGVRKLSDATQGVVAELTQFVGSFAGSFTVFAPATGTAANYGWRCRGNGTVPIVNSPTTFAAPDTAVFTGIGDISGDIATLRIDGVQVATDTTTDQGTGNFANDIFYIGRRGGSSLPFNGNIYSLIVRGAESTTGQITATETWVNGKTGAY